MPTVMPRETPWLSLPMLRDNYLWVLVAAGAALAVDVGDYAVLADFLSRSGARLAAVLVTHHHPDHTGGLAELRRSHPETPVYGPEGIPGITHLLHGGELLDLGGLGVWHVLDTAGHTRFHLSFHEPRRGWLMCGDTLFSAGCGRVLGGDLGLLYRAVRRIASLPPDTLLFPSHEYTLANIAFARAVEPHNADLIAYDGQCRARRAAGRPTLPVALGGELLVNPFLRTDRVDLRRALPADCGNDPESLFRALRQWKDVWQA